MVVNYSNQLALDSVSTIRQHSLLFAALLHYSYKNSERGVPMIGSQIAQLRQERGMRQAELAELLQISASAVGMYEQGRRSPSLSMVVQLSRVFDVTVDYLLTGKPPRI